MIQHGKIVVVIVAHTGHDDATTGFQPLFQGHFNLWPVANRTRTNDLALTIFSVPSFLPVSSLLFSFCF